MKSKKLIENWQKNILIKKIHFLLIFCIFIIKTIWENEKQIMKRLEVIFDYAMSKPNEHGINFLRDDYEFRPQIHTIAKYLNTGDVDMVYDIIDGVFNQE